MKRGEKFKGDTVVKSVRIAGSYKTVRTGKFPLDLVESHQ